MADELAGDIMGLLDDAKNFYNVTKDDPEAFGLTGTQVTTLNTKITATETKIDEQTAANTLKLTKTAERKETSLDFEKYFRGLRQVVQARPETTDAQRAALRLATGEGDGGDGLATALENAPLLLVEHAGIHQHRSWFYMVGEPAKSTKKPKGVLGGKIYLKIDGEASTDLKDYRLIALDTKAPYDYTHDAADAGKTAHYICVWATADDEESPQSEVFSIKIT